MNIRSAIVKIVSKWRGYLVYRISIHESTFQSIHISNCQNKTGPVWLLYSDYYPFLKFLIPQGSTGSSRVFFFFFYVKWKPIFFSLLTKISASNLLYFGSYSRKCTYFWYTNFLKNMLSKRAKTRRLLFAKL